MTPVQIGLLISLGCIIYLWSSTYHRRIELYDKAWFYKPAIHGDDYKRKCLELYAEFKGMRLYSSIITAIWVLAVMHHWSVGNL